MGSRDAVMGTTRPGPMVRLARLGSTAQARGPIEGLPGGPVGAQLRELLALRNGFYAFGSALLVRGAGPGPSDLDAWNRPGGWRVEYQDLAEGLFFFAEDAFGSQFAIQGQGEHERVVSFDPETGARQVVAPDVEAWCRSVLDDFEFYTGYPVAEAWQRLHGPLAIGTRLVPTRLFVLGGTYESSNLSPMNDAISMRYRGGIAIQIRDLPDGAAVDFRIVD